MRSYVLFSVVCLQLGWIYGEPGGVGVYAYQDTAGNRYGGTYELDDAQLFGKGKGAGGVNRFGDSGANPYGGWNNFIPNFGQGFQQFDDFFPEYFSNLENLLREAFNKNFENQRLAYNAAKKAYDLTSNQAGYIPHSPGRFDSFGGFGGSWMPMMEQNSAFAGGAVGPGYQHQVAAISPENPTMQNVNVMNRFADTANSNPRDGFYSVSSSSFASSSDVNGKKQETRGAETVVNNNGQVTRYKVHN